MMGSPNTEELLRLAMDARVRDVWVSLPGTVVAVAGNRADVRPVVKRPVPTPEEDVLAEELPVIPSCPILSLAGGGFSIAFPVAVGDEVLLLVSTLDPAEWLRTGEVSEPPDRRVHHLAHALVLPVRMRTVIPAASATDLVVSKDGAIVLTLTPTALKVDGDAHSATRDDLVASAFADLRTALTAGTAGGDALLVTWTPPTAAALASARLKVGS